MNNNITMDYSKSTIDNQELAVMPASLAKRLLDMLASQLTSVSSKDIIGNHMDELRKCDTIEQSVECSINYVNTRSLISNVRANNWDFYKVTAEVAPEKILNPEGYEVTDGGIVAKSEGVRVIGKIEIPKRFDYCKD